MVAAMALTVFPNTTMRLGYVPGPGRVAPAALRRAVAYIEEHAAEPVTTSDIAEAARVTPRVLQAVFRRHYGATPTGYLRRVRLERAHRDLQAAAPATGETVSAIAARWGFGHAARFTGLYREQYGVLPSRTLRA
jgi:transcriptional regulator GlxA family with amidase domain